jgi:alpha-tubulin suppressor-like RCC1 family protein
VRRSASARIEVVAPVSFGQTAEMRAGLLLLLPLLGAGALWASCLAPTEITLELTTDADYQAVSHYGTRISVGAPGGALGIATETSACNPSGRIGSLVVVPSGSRDESVAIEILTAVSRPLDDCAPHGFDGCILARRQLSYLAHKPLKLPIQMSMACLGTPCAANETCVDGKCRSSVIDDPSQCEGDGCVLTAGAGGGGGQGGQAPDGGPGGGTVTGRIATRFSHMCAVAGDGRAKCWGTNTRGECGSDTGGASVLTATEVTNLGVGSGVTAVGTGNGDSCALLASPPAVVCWGGNTAGELGHGSIDGNNHPIPTAVGLAEEPVELVVGAFHACARSASGTVQCWGANDRGQLGDLTAADPSPATTVPGLVASALAAGEYHTCAVVQATGALECWGLGSAGQLGNGGLPAKAGPTPVTGLDSGVVAVAAASAHTCAIHRGDQSSELLCWGSNQWGQLGTGTAADHPDHYTAVVVPALAPEPVGVTAGNLTTCALLANGALTCWGNNDSGALGSGDFVSRYQPGAPVPGLGAVAEGAAGNSRACALLVNGSAWCWGQAPLGNDNVSGSSSPVQVVGFP